MLVGHVSTQVLGVTTVLMNLLFLHFSQTLSLEQSSQSAIALHTHLLSTNLSQLKLHF